MGKVVLTSKAEPTYNDLPEKRYHFPRTYLRQIESAIGDWVLYYEPRRTSGDLMSSGGKQAYFATARLDKVEPDLQLADHFYAYVSDFLPFDNMVPFKLDNFYFEKALKKDDGTTNKGAFGRSVRVIPDSEYDFILQNGFAHILGQKERTRIGNDKPEEPMAPIFGFSENEQMPFEVETQVRSIVSQVTNRPFRDRAFSAAVKTVYQDTCAISGIKLINGGGRSEVQAAHIRPVAANGPDSVRNGIALSGTIHWMFDRGLISIDDDYRVLVASSSSPAAFSRLIDPDRKILLPTRLDERPHLQFLKYHREHVFKG